MLELSRGLPARALRAVAELEQRTVAVDGGRLKLEWAVLNNRSGDAVEDLLWWDDGRLLGFLGLYAFGGVTLELAGMVDPAGRRHGVATALLDAALPLCHERGYATALLVTPRASAAARSLARGRGATLSHSEYALVLAGDPNPAADDPRIVVRAATPADAADVVRVLEVAFGSAPTNVAAQLASPTSGALLIEFDGRPVGAMRVERGSDGAGIYGFAVDPAWQGRGIGRDVLRRVCRQLRADGVARIGLEVAVDNERALGLYTSIGFTPLTTEDYYALPLS